MTETSRTFSNTGGVTAESRAFFTASPACKSPYPYRLSYPASPKSKALSCKTSRIMEFEYEGIAPETKAAAPETCGAAIAVFINSGIAARGHDIESFTKVRIIRQVFVIPCGPNRYNVIIVSRRIRQGGRPVVSRGGNNSHPLDRKSTR